MSTHSEKKLAARHPTDVEPAHPHDRLVSAETGARLLTHLGLTEGEALAILAAQDATEEELALVSKVDLHAVAAALDEATVHALVTDPKLDLGTHGEAFEARATSLRSVAAAEDKLQHIVDSLHGAARLDAAIAQDVINVVVPQIRAGARPNPAMRVVYSSLLAYQRTRFPGGRGRQQAPAAEEPPPPSGTTAVRKV